MYKIIVDKKNSAAKNKQCCLKKYITCVSLAAEQLIRSYSSGSLQCPLSMALDPMTTYTTYSEEHNTHAFNIIQ